MTRLVTERVTRAEAEQRRGRAGRVAPGWCYRLWTRGEEGALAAFPPPEIASADLAGLALELALWGAASPDGLAFLTPPPAPAFAEARALLAELGALDAGGRITAHGRALAALPVHPRLGHMLVEAARRRRRRARRRPRRARRGARPVARRGGAAADLALRLAALRDPGDRAVRRPRRHRRAPRRGAAAAGARARPRPAPGLAPAPCCRSPIPTGSASAGPGRRRATCCPAARARRCPTTTRSRGAAASSPPTSTATRARRRSGWRCRSPRANCARCTPTGSAASGSAPGRAATAPSIARERLMLGALALEDRPWPDAPPERVAAALLDGIRELGLDALPWTPAARRFAARVALAARQRRAGSAGFRARGAARRARRPGSRRTSPA